MGINRLSTARLCRRYEVGKPARGKTTQEGTKDSGYLSSNKRPAVLLLTSHAESHALLPVGCKPVWTSHSHIQGLDVCVDPLICQGLRWEMGLRYPRNRCNRWAHCREAIRMSTGYLSFHHACCLML